MRKLPDYVLQAIAGMGFKCHPPNPTGDEIDDDDEGWWYAYGYRISDDKPVLVTVSSTTFEFQIEVLESLALKTVDKKINL